MALDRLTDGSQTNLLDGIALVDDAQQQVIGQKRLVVEDCARSAETFARRRFAHRCGGILQIDRVRWFVPGRATTSLENDIMGGKPRPGHRHTYLFGIVLVATMSERQTTNQLQWHDLRADSVESG